MKLSRLLPGLAIVAAAAAVYGNSLRGPLVFDDLDSIVRNPTLRLPFSLARLLSPPGGEGQTVGGRPILNLTLGLNYAAGGLHVAGYHLVNLLIHAAAGLVLFALARLTLERMGGGAKDRATPMAFVIALLWTVHPLQTEAVTYVVQRAESLMSLFYLLTLYCLGWNPALSVLFCFLGMGTKEVMVSAPIVVLLYDRTFISGSFRAALRARPGYYLALASSWLWLGALVLSGGGRGGTAGLNVPISWRTYFETQLAGLPHYLALIVWPHPLIFDYGAQWITGWPVAAGALLAAGLIAGTIFALAPTDLEFAPRVRLRPALGFLGAWFFLLLAPTALVPGIRQVLAEHRLYLALAPVIAALVGAIGLHITLNRPRAGRAAFAGSIVVAAILAVLTVYRNRVYRTDLSLWSDTVAHRPLNPYAHNNLGDAWRRAGNMAEAERQFESAIELKPDLAEAQNNLGNLRREQGRRDEAEARFRRALAIRPVYPEAYNNLGVVLTAEGRTAEAKAAFGRALELRPDYAQAQFNRGVAEGGAGEMTEAVADYRAALISDPSLGEARLNLATALARRGHLAEAADELRALLRTEPANVAAHFDLGTVLAMQQRYPEAVAQYEATLRLDPAHSGARSNLARLRDALNSAGALSP